MLQQPIFADTHIHLVHVAQNNDVRAFFGQCVHTTPLDSSDVASRLDHAVKVAHQEIVGALAVVAFGTLQEMVQVVGEGQNFGSRELSFPHN